MQKIVVHVAISLFTFVIMALVGEGVVRLKNHNQTNYTVEMWRYARELKEVNQEFGHVHKPALSVKLQNVTIELNSLGLRGPEPSPSATPTVLMLGSSITLGWGVQENQTARAELEKLLGGNAQVLNAGIGNYNATRYVGLFEKRLRGYIKPNVVIVHYFIDDAKPIEPNTGNWFMQNSQLSVTLYYIASKMLYGSSDLTSLKNHYEAIYAANSPAYQAMNSAFERLQELAKEDGFKVILAVIPDVHQLENYPFRSIHKQMEQIAVNKGWTYVDLLDGLKMFKGPELWTIQGDPHPNGVAHKLMAEQIYRAMAR